MLLSLSILNTDLDKIEEFLSPIKFNPIIHMDIMDGKFVSNTSFDEKIVERCYNVSPRSIIETHLMVEKPELLFEKYKKAHSDYIIIHLETMNVGNNIKLIHELGMKAGLSIKPNTKVEDLVPYLDKIEEVLVMSVEPGKGGQEFMMDSINKLKFLKEYKIKNDLHYLINVDGGINDKTYKYVKEYSDIAVVGSYITKDSNYVLKYYQLLKDFMEV